MTHTTRKLTGKPSWPIMLLAGAEKVGKTWQAVAASQSPLIARCLWFPLGEKDPDEYGAMQGFDGDRFDLVEHDGTYRSLLDALNDELAAERAAGPDAPPTLWVLDSASRLWDVLSSMAQREMYERMRRKAEDAARKGHRAATPDPERKPSVDLWNVAADRWGHVMDALRAHRGPVIICARMELRTVMDAKGDPTKDKEQKVLAQKSLPFDVDAIVEMPQRGETWLTGVRSVRLAGLPPRKKLDGFTVDDLWRKLGLDETVEHRRNTAADTTVGESSDDAPDEGDADTARGELLELCHSLDLDPGSAAARYAAKHSTAIQAETDPAKLRAFATELRAEFAVAEAGGQS